MKNTLLTILFVLLALALVGQSVTVTISGTLKDERNTRLLHEVELSVYDMIDDGVIGTAYSNNQGQYIVQVPSNGSYIIRATRQAYYDKEIFLDIANDNKVLDVNLVRLPGYEFEGTIKELLSYSTGNIGKELNNTKVEIYNNTISKKIIFIEDDPDNTFKVNFERGNHYTILLRKKGYFAKRIEVFVDVEGCILCFEGLGTYTSPEIESAMTNNNERGSIIADIPMKKIVQDEAIVLDNIYYDYNKWNIRKDARPQLENLVKILKRNPIVIELSSHTDSRGKDDYNIELSQKRAQSAVDYIVSRGIKSNRITAKGYGETQLLNSCNDGAVCNEADHQKNRRTEFKVTAFMEESSFDARTLKEIIEQERSTGKRQIESILILEK